MHTTHRPTTAATTPNRALPLGKTISEGSEIHTAGDFRRVESRFQGELGRYLVKSPGDPRLVAVSRGALPKNVRQQMDKTGEAFRQRIFNGVANEAEHRFSEPTDGSAYAMQIDGNYVVRGSAYAIRLDDEAGGKVGVGYVFDHVVRDETGENSKIYRERSVFSMDPTPKGAVLSFLTSC